MRSSWVLWWPESITTVLTRDTEEDTGTHRRDHVRRRQRLEGQAPRERQEGPPTPTPGPPEGAQLCDPWLWDVWLQSPESRLPCVGPRMWLGSSSRGVLVLSGVPEGWAGSPGSHFWRGWGAGGGAEARRAPLRWHRCGWCPVAAGCSWRGAQPRRPHLQGRVAPSPARAEHRGPPAPGLPGALSSRRPWRERLDPSREGTAVSHSEWMTDGAGPRGAGGAGEAGT